MNKDVHAGPEAPPPTPFTKTIHLVGGINFTTWADLKWSRGSSHVTSMQARLGEWNASAPVSIKTALAEDRQGINLVAHAPRGVPKHEWSLDLGDALHNFRSAFDAVAWGMAHFDDKKPSRPKFVSFPICQSEEQWNKALRDWVGEIDPALQERLRIMQPFTFVPEGNRSMLTMLHDLDIQDKHRDMLTVSVNLDGVDLDGAFEYEDPDVTPDGIRVEMVPDAKFEDGVTLGTIHVGAPIRAPGHLIVRPQLRLQLEYENIMHDAMPLLQTLVTETRRCLDILMHGLATPDDVESEDWQPVEVTPW